MSISLYAESVLRSAGMYGMVDGSLRNLGKEDVYQISLPSVSTLSSISCPFEPSFFIVYPLSIDTGSTNGTIGKFIAAVSNPDSPYHLFHITGYRSGSSGAKVTTLEKEWSYSDGDLTFSPSFSHINGKFGFLAIP